MTAVMTAILTTDPEVIFLQGFGVTLFFEFIYYTPIFSYQDGIKITVVFILTSLHSLKPSQPCSC